MNKFDKVKRYYDTKTWNCEMVYNAVAQGWITQEQYTEITGKSYSEGF